MADTIQYARRTPERLIQTDKVAELFSDWRGDAECWLFISPHDDDVAIGAGLTLQTGLAAGAQVHTMVVTDGRMGYCRLEQRRTIVKVRRSEAEHAYQILGLPADRLQFMECPDCYLNAYRGRHFATIGAPTEIEGAGGMQNAFTYILRQIRPNRVFLSTSADLHPTHQIVHEEALISLFHAQGNIWPELGPATVEVPKVYEFAVYCDFPQPPQIRIETTPAILETKLQAILAFASQEQIGSLVEIQRAVGPVEYLRELEFQFYSPQKYAGLFASPT